MKEPKRIKLNPETPTPKEPPKYRLPPLDKPEWNISGQDHDDMYVKIKKEVAKRPDMCVLHPKEGNIYIY